MIKLVRMLHKPLIGRNERLFGVDASTKMMPHFRLNKLHQVTSRPLTRMLIALAVPAIVEMKSPMPSTWPTSSGKV